MWFFSLSLRWLTLLSGVVSKVLFFRSSCEGLHCDIVLVPFRHFLYVLQSYVVDISSGINLKQNSFSLTFIIVPVFTHVQRTSFVYTQTKCQRRDAHYTLVTTSLCNANKQHVKCSTNLYKVLSTYNDSHYKDPTENL